MKLHRYIWYGYMRLFVAAIWKKVKTFRYLFLKYENKWEKLPPCDVI